MLSFDNYCVWCFTLKLRLYIREHIFLGLLQIKLSLISEVVSLLNNGLQASSTDQYFYSKFDMPDTFGPFKENEKRNKYLDLVQEIKKLWNMKMTLISIITDAQGTVPKGLIKRLEELEIGGHVETIQTASLLRSARILRRVLET